MKIAFYIPRGRATGASRSPRSANGRARNHPAATPRAGATLIAVMLTTLIAGTALAGCGDEDSATTTSNASGKLTVYSGREPELVEPLFKRFERATGIDVELRSAESPELSATITEEGESSPADVFYAQDAGSIGALRRDGLLAKLPPSTLESVDRRFRAPSGEWVGVSGRVRVLAYNTERVRRSDLPGSVLDLTESPWRGRVGIAPGNASFQAFVSGMRASTGDAKTARWLRQMKANDVKIYEKNGQIVEAVARGEIDAGLVNHYYLYEIKAEQPDAPVANHFFRDGDPGTMVNVSAVGILKHARHPAAAQRFIDFLLDAGQRFFARDAEEKEYPLVAAAGATPPADLKPLDEIRGPAGVSLDALGDELSASVEMIRAAGLGAY